MIIIIFYVYNAERYDFEQKNKYILFVYFFVCKIMKSILLYTTFMEMFNIFRPASS